MLLAAAAWGFFSVVPGQTTQAALTWIWGEDVAPYMSLLHAGFGLGSLIAPVLVSWDLAEHQVRVMLAFLAPPYSLLKMHRVVQSLRPSTPRTWSSASSTSWRRSPPSG